MENILEAISKLEKEKNSLLERMEQSQFRGRIANNRMAEFSNQIKAVSNFKAEKESNRLLVKLRVDTRQSQFDDIKTKIRRREQGEQVVPLDLNGNETQAEGDAAAKYCRSESSNSGRILHAKVGTKARPGEATSMAKQYPGIAISY